jgi:hypothetical protein
MRRITRWTTVAALSALCATLTGTKIAGATIFVPAGADLQEALDQARPGDILVLDAGARYVGNFVLPAKGGTQPITIRTRTPDNRLPGPNDRIAPANAELLPIIASPNNQPALRTAPGASHWRLLAVSFLGNGAAGDLIQLGDGSSAQKDMDNLPEDLTFDRVLILGDPDKGQKRGIALNSGAATIRNSYISDIKTAGQESQAIAGWNGPGPYTIENNFLEAAGVNILFGGADPAIPELIPSDIVIKRNHFTKKTEWRGSNWTVKNLVELKSARRVVIEGNLIDQCWSAAQPGYAVLFTVRNSSGKAPFSTIEQVVFRNNLVRNVAAGVNILGIDDLQPSGQANDILISNNLFLNVNHRQWGGNGTFLQVGNSPSNVRVDHNTVVQTGNVVTAYGGSAKAPKQIPEFQFTNNIASHNAYGIFGNSTGVGKAAIDKYFPDAKIVANVLAGGQASRYPAGNFFPSAAQMLLDFVNAQAGDYRLNDRSPYRRAATDGTAIGVNVDQMRRAMNPQDR